MSETVAVQFKQYFPVLPLPETMLLPHAIIPLSVFEPRYRQLVDHSLDGSGQVAIATYNDVCWKQHKKNESILRDVVCLAQIIQHEKAGDGFQIMLYGLCRAIILEECPPDDDTLYRSAKLRPLEQEEEELDEIYRTELLHMLFRPNLMRLENHDAIVDWVNEPTLTNDALFELVGCSVFDDAELKYALLAEPSSEVRSKRVLCELAHIDRMLTITDKQSSSKWENGISWN
ncbi:MAG: LON peptidase substrate-binding domain-containing protein [Phycisphaerae bacterium]|jgi:Lon protease-like protein|nr:LON peptidase substrate-binding domain-containing protein [Phycisphaerae bacterium]